MIWRKISLVLSVFSTFHSTIGSVEVPDIYDIQSVESFVDKLENMAENYHKSANVILPEDEEQITSKIIIRDMISILEQLNLIDNDIRDDYWQDYMNKVMKIFDDYEVKGGISRWSMSLFDFSAIIEVKRDVINTYVRGLLYLHSNNYLKLTVDSCLYFLDVADFLDKNFNDGSIVDIYKSFLTSTLISMYFAEDWLNVCGQRSSINREFYDYYRSVTTSYFKMWIIHYFAGILRSHCKNNQDELKHFMKNARTTLIEKLTANLRLNKKIIIESNKYSIYQCDNRVVNDIINFIDYQEKKKTFFEMEKMTQAVIINEIDLRKSRRCNSNCDLTKIEDLNTSVCQNFTECQYLSKSFEICESNKNESRNYEWFKDDKGIIYGSNQNQTCSNTIKSVSRNYQASTMFYCNYCVCICQKHPENKKNVTTKISFRSQVSNIEKNKVVVGVRFEKKDNMIHLQIKEAELDSFNRRAEVVAWKELENFVYNKNDDEFHIVINNSTKKSLTLGLDYTQHPGGMNLDDLIAPPGFVITGVQFGCAGDSLDSPNMKSDAIELRIRVTPFNIVEKKLIDLQKTYWISPEHEDKRVELILNEPDVPTKSIENKIDSKPGQFVKFRASDLKKDAGQTTVPYFDVLPAEGIPPFPLGGLGIGHRGSNGSGGCFALRIFDLDVSQEFKVPPESE